MSFTLIVLKKKKFFKIMGNIGTFKATGIDKPTARFLKHGSETLSNFIYLDFKMF